jgi:GTP:adenosylcobinamide-phosphate guanylyltransferase
MQALILAGGAAPPELAAATNCSERALIEIGGQPMIVRVLEALRGTSQIDEIAVVGAESTLQAARDAQSGVTQIAAAGRMVDNLTRGLQALSSPAVLVCTCDIPFATPATFDELLRRAAERKLELAYPIVRRATSEAAFPHGERTYAKLLDGEWTGGNAVLIPRHIIGRASALIDAAYNARKNPLALARILGPGFLMKLLSKRLSIAETESKAGQVLGCHAGAVEMQDAAIAFDVDKPDDLRMVQSVLAPRVV